MARAEGAQRSDLVSLGFRIIVEQRRIPRSDALEDSIAAGAIEGDIDRGAAARSPCRVPSTRQARYASTGADGPGVRDSLSDRKMVSAKVTVRGYEQIVDR